MNKESGFRSRESGVSQGPGIRIQGSEARVIVLRKAPQRSRKPSSVRPRQPDGWLRRDDHSSSPAITGGIKRPTRRLRTGRPDNASLFGLAPCGVLPATNVAVGAVRSYRTFSPLPFDSPHQPFGRHGSLRAVYFLCHFPSGHPDRALPGALPYGVRTFLPAPAFPAARAPRDNRCAAVVWLPAANCQRATGDGPTLTAPRPIPG